MIIIFATMRKLCVLGILLLFACQENEPDSPEMLTEEAQQIGASSVVMGANIKAVGPVRPINYGFLWDTNKDISVFSAKDKLVLGSTSEARTFSIKLDNLTSSTTYYYRCFAANSDFTKIYYGNTVSFTTLP